MAVAYSSRAGREQERRLRSKSLVSRKKESRLAGPSSPHAAARRSSPQPSRPKHPSIRQPLTPSLFSRQHVWRKVQSKVHLVRPLPLLSTCPRRRRPSPSQAGSAGASGRGPFALSDARKLRPPCSLARPRPAFSLPFSLLARTQKPLFLPARAVHPGQAPPLTRSLLPARLTLCVLPLARLWMTSTEP
jgi:hypothetical protein